MRLNDYRQQRIEGRARTLYYLGNRDKGASFGNWNTLSNTDKRHYIELATTSLQLASLLPGYPLHKVQLHFSYGDAAQVKLVCKQEPPALCLAQFDCDCVQYVNLRVGSDGLPQHDLAGEEHRAVWGNTCVLAESFDGFEDLMGKVEFEVLPSWNGEWFEHEVVA